MERRWVPKAISGIAIASAHAADINGGESGTLATIVSDQPGDIGDFETLLIQISGVFGNPEDEERRRFDADPEIDLTEFVDEASEFTDKTELDTVTYEFLHLEPAATEATLSGGGPATLETPSDGPLKFEKQFEIRIAQTTSFIADSTPVKQGQTDRSVLQPVVDGVEVIYGTETEA